MANINNFNKKAKQLSIEEYEKIKESRAKSRLNLHFPLLIKICILVPFIFCLFLISFYIFYARFLPEH